MIAPVKYVNRFIGWNSAAEMLEMKLFPNIKEIAESVSMLYCVEQKLMGWDTDIEKKREDINVVVIGDGVSPRTACVFAFHTNWNCYSIDPLLRKEEYPVRKLKVYQKEIKEVKLNFGDQITIIIMPHSHAPIEECWNNVQSTRKWLIKLECCTKDRLDFPGITYRDKYAITPENQIFIWNNYKTCKF